MADEPFVLFLGFSVLWILMGIATIIWVLKSEKSALKLNKELILVGLSILLPFGLALLIGFARY